MLEFDLNDTQRFLCLCIRHCDFLQHDEIRRLYEKLDDEELFQEAKKNGVQSIVAHSLTKVFGSENVHAHWLDEYEIVNKRISSYMDELERAAALLQEHDIKLLALKNSGITKVLYPHYGACPMGDIDVLVDKSQFREAHEVLKSEGYKLKFRSPLEEDNIEAAEHGGGAEYQVQLPNGDMLWFELQWRPVAGRWIQPDQEPTSTELVKRSIKLPNSYVRLLSNEDNLLQVSLHTAKHTFVRAPGFRLHTDVDRIVSSLEIDWNLFVNKVKSLKTNTAVYFSLAMAKSLLGTQVPDEVLEQIKPSKLKIKIMKSWLERVGIFYPDEPKWSRLGYIIFVSMLYDSLFDLLRGIFPSAQSIKEQYNVKSNWQLPFYYLKRIANLVFKRVGI